MGFFSVPRLPGWSFQQRIHEGVLPPPHCPDKSGPAGSPTDTLRKDSTLPPVTSKKSIVFLRMMKIGGFFKGLIPLPIFLEPILVYLFYYIKKQRRSNAIEIEAMPKRGKNAVTENLKIITDAVYC
jgi:hypothetical protein